MRIHHEAAVGKSSSMGAKLIWLRYEVGSTTGHFDLWGELDGMLNLLRKVSLLMEILRTFLKFSLNNLNFINVWVNKTFHVESNCDCSWFTCHVDRQLQILLVSSLFLHLTTFQRQWLPLHHKPKKKERKNIQISSTIKEVVPSRWQLPGPLNSLLYRRQFPLLVNF